MNHDTMQGNWNQLKGQLRQEWGQLTDNELEQFEGNLDELVGMIQEKTGEAREAVESKIAEMSQDTDASAMKQSNGDGGESTPDMEQMTAQAQEYAQQAAAAVQQTAEQAAESLREKYRDAEQAVRRKPLESLAMSFAAGLVVGVGATLILRSK